jgi:MFS family permease
MDAIERTKQRNFRIHLLEGALYISSGALLSAQTVLPALLTRLGAGNLAIGLLPVIVYVVYFVPQLLGAHWAVRSPFRKPLVLRLGWIQRSHIGALALVVGLLGASHPRATIVLVFVIYASNQLFAGLGSPAWYDLTVKTISPERRGVLLGMRVSLGATLGFLNGLFVSILLASFVFPADYATIIGLGFLLQVASVLIQRHVAEWEPSTVHPSPRPQMLVIRVREIVTEDRAFRRFLAASALVVVSFSGVGFFTVSALRRLAPPDSIVGLFTIVAVGAQVLSGVTMGMVGDRLGSKVALVITACGLAAAEFSAAWAGSVAAYVAVFAFTGVNLGAELVARYNFASECAKPDERALYVGLMNLWLAPWYLFSLAAGWFIDRVGGRPVFLGCAVLALVAAAILASLPNPRSRRLAVSSK